MVHTLSSHTGSRRGKRQGVRAAHGFAKLRAVVVLATLAVTGISAVCAAGFDDFKSRMAPATRSAVTSVMVAGNSSKSVAETAAFASIAVGDERDAPRCNDRLQALCRDFAASEFQITSLRFMLPEVRGLSPKSLNIRRNRVSATYTFR